MAKKSRQKLNYGKELKYRKSTPTIAKKQQIYDFSTVKIVSFGNTLKSIDFYFGHCGIPQTTLGHVGMKNQL